MLIKKCSAPKCPFYQTVEKTVLNIILLFSELAQNKAWFGCVLHEDAVFDFFLTFSDVRIHRDRKLLESFYPVKAIQI